MNKYSINIHLLQMKNKLPCAHPRRKKISKIMSLTNKYSINIHLSQMKNKLPCAHFCTA